MTSYDIVINSTTNSGVVSTNYTPASALIVGTHTWKVRPIHLQLKKRRYPQTNTFSIKPNPLFRDETMEIIYGFESGTDVKFEVYTMVGSLVRIITPGVSNYKAHCMVKMMMGKKWTVEFI